MREPFLNADDNGINAAEKELERVLRPQQFEEFFGQPKIVDNLKVFITAAKQRGDALDHLLLHGPPGLGKTTLSHIVANELGVSLKLTSGPVLEKPGDLAGLLTGLEEGDVLFIDEIHRLSTVVEEYLYSAMEDFKIDIMIDTGPNARSIQLTLNHFTLIGATTRSGLLSAPLRSRFGITSRVDYYDAETLKKILKRSADILNIKLFDDACSEIARRSRGTPRIANALLRRLRDFAQVKGKGKIDLAIARSSLQALNVDEHGLDEMDNRILTAIIDKFSGGPVGITTIATSVGEEGGTIEEVYEPFLIQEGYLKRTPRGREATEKAYKHLGREIKPGRGVCFSFLLDLRINELHFISNKSKMKNKINTLEIKNFKSIRNLKLKCKRVNVFVGKPNVGKSNILEALSMFGWNYKKNDSPFLSEYVRFNKTIELFFNKNSKNNIEIKIDYGYIAIRSKFQNHFDFILSKNDEIVSKLSERNTGNQNNMIFGKYIGENDSINWPITPYLHHLSAKPNIDERLAPSYYNSPVKKYSFDPFTKRINTYDSFLLPPDGNNLGIILKNDKNLLNRFAELIEAEYGWNLTIEEPDFEIKLLKKEGSSFISTDFNLIADTLQRIIFYHAAISSNKDSVLIFEEPEVHSFPPYVTMLAESIIRDKKNEYFLSTHNPYLLNTLLEKTPFEDLALFYVGYDNYETTIQTINKKQISEILSYGIDVFLNWEKFTVDAK